MPLDNTRVIPDGWAAHHRPVVAQALTVDVTIREPGSTPSGPRDPETGVRPSAPHSPHFTGKARIQVTPIAGSAEVVTADQEVTQVAYLVVVDRDESAETAVEHIVKITAVDDNADPTLVGRELTVAVVRRGSLTWERDLICIDDLG